MTNEEQEARRAYKREWARTHPENVKRAQEKFWAKKAQEQKQQEQQAQETAEPEQ